MKEVGFKGSHVVSIHLEKNVPNANLYTECIACLGPGGERLLMDTRLLFRGTKTFPKVEC